MALVPDRNSFSDARADQCRRVSYKFEQLTALAGDASRKHVFAHFLVPHPPFVLNADGSCRTLAAAKRASRRDNYLTQLALVNARLLPLIDAILSGPRPAVIVIHSDEGPWPEPFVGNEHALGQDPVRVNWTAASPAQLREKMGVLLAVRGPIGPPRVMPDSPVAIYPAILREHFGSDRPLPRSTYRIFENDRALYRFKDVRGVLFDAPKPLSRR